ncbi:3-hydroxyacyl-CoA dehydrogenase NAD-binding domain-containing protein [Actibacterium sp. 188UL27-1]|uniref:3-hydroxyacyl-CoA dehydrogenase NAD-binding domain-containing protein n=1 Tax=Actibacterium sp. 188UL27-1 TaxID=2786961 RepID=UPI0019566FE0|nr:3-hydroxyacyl-CoA dehydrogenase NAD-binding domain-containing protein [Actibacterium sp. 188UL27-1]MBM7069647.1 enoyl-CoA hydratase/isomerase family protein [Actibacterium sp. 188UL27-1]
MSEVVTTERVGAVALIALDNPPVNAASHALRNGIQDAIATLDADPEVKVIAIYGKGRTFIAGADIREFGKPPKEPHLPNLCTQIENCATPVISILHGTTLGGGLEVAQATHARIGITGVKVGLPEVLIGIMPGAGGTQRTPRLTGVPAALDMITSGRHVPTEEAHKIGLLDQVVDLEPRAAALSAAQDVLDGKLETRRTGQIAVTPDEAAITEWRTRMAAKHPNLISPLKCVDGVAAATLPIAEGMAEERRLFTDCMDSPQRAGLIHAFFAERAVAKIPEATATSRDIASIGVIGGGTMGSGIATAALMAGLPVALIERDQQAMDKTAATITGNLDGAVKRGKMTAATRDTILADRLTLATDFATLNTADLIIEAVFEEMEIKKEIFARLDTIAKPGAILASNTSFLDIDEIAAGTSRPADVLGLHFFSPAHIMRLLEVVVGAQTDPGVVATGFALAKKLRKVGVRAEVCDGFIGNRILAHYRKVADYLVMDGASPWEVDSALEDFGFAMGPFAVSDLAGLDIGWATRKRLAATKPPEERDVVIADRICENGWFGRKTGKGYYVHDGRDSSPNPVVDQIVEAERKAAGITPRDFTDDEIVNRYMTAMISEAARVIEDGIALRPIDVDAVYLFGYGFPRFRGGPLFYADQIGAATLVERIHTYAEEDAHYWQVPDILHQMARNGTAFADLNKES